VRDETCQFIASPRSLYCIGETLGFSLRARESLLRDFVAFVEASGIKGLISAQIALDWACSASEHCGISGKAARLSIARRFLFYLG